MSAFATGVSSIAEEQVKATITPRVWFSTAGEKYHSGRTDFQESTDLFTLPLYGVTIGLKPSSWESSSILFSGFYGIGDAEYSAVKNNGGNYLGSADISRLDIEFSVLSKLSDEENIQIGYGLRYVNVETDINAKDQNFIDVSNTWTTDLYLAQFSLLFGTPTDFDKEKSQIFGGTTLMLGYADYNETSDEFTGISYNETAPFAGIDAYVGLSYSPAEGNALSARYRLFAGSVFDPSYGVDDSDTTAFFVHGPEISWTIRF